MIYSLEFVGSFVTQISLYMAVAAAKIVSIHQYMFLVYMFLVQCVVSHTTFHFICM
jgi:hypothetical protein